jgi:hypothetical protein
LAIGGADNAVEQAFGSLDVGGLGGDIASIFGLVATSCPTDSLGVGLFGSIGAYDTYVGRFLVFRNVLLIDEEQRVGAGGHVGLGSKSLEHATNFIGVGSLP